MAHFKDENQKETPPPRGRTCPKVALWGKQQQLQPDSQSRRCGNGERRKAGEEQREPPQGAGRGPGCPAGRREVSGPQPLPQLQADEPSAPGTAPEPLPAAPDGGARGAGGALPAGSGARPPASARPAPGTGKEPRVPLAGSQPARPEPRPQPEHAVVSPGPPGLPSASLARPAPAGAEARGLGRSGRR